MPGGGGRFRWQVWRSPGDQPAWARPLLLVIAAFATALYSWNITTSGYALFYSNSVRSMGVSWKAWLFGAMDPGATITLDKIPGAFAVQALSVRLFGFHQWSVTLPQVIEGVVAVLVLYRVVRRWAGPAAGLVAAALFTLTPVVASMFAHSMEDGALTCCLVLAADRCQVAVASGRLRPLLWAAFWVGVGFQMKMVQAWMVLPALALAYLLVAPGPVRRRLWHTAVAGVVCLAVSVSWVAMMELVPAGDRPYVDGSTNNSAVAMVFGYNALDRFGVQLPGAVHSMFGTPGGSGGGDGPTAGRPPGGGPGAPAAGPRPGGPVVAYGPPVGGGPRWLKLFEGRFAPQIGWLLPFALFAAVLGLYRTRRADRTDPARGGFVLWGTWLLVVGLVFSDMDAIPHTAYMSTLAPAIAALCGAGAVLLWRAHRDGGRAGWLLPAVVAGQAAWTWHLWSGSADFAPWLRWTGLLAAVAAVLVLVPARLGGRGRARLATIGALVGLASTAVGATAWSASVFDQRDAGSAFDAAAGPQAGMFMGMGPTKGKAPAGPPAGAEGPGRPGGNGEAGGGAKAGGGTGGTTDHLTPDQQKLWSYVEAHRDGAEYPLATVGWMAAQPFILATGQKVLPMGGFSGQVPQPALGAFTDLVRQGRVHYVLTGGGMGMMPSGGGDDGVAAWTKDHCTAVAATQYGGPAIAAPSGSGGTLYRCDPAEAG
ncbi:hypothetical protein GCM10009738_76450 [Kitasatospora viridis]